MFPYVLLCVMLCVLFCVYACLRMYVVCNLTKVNQKIIIKVDVHLCFAMCFAMCIVLCICVFVYVYKSKPCVKENREVLYSLRNLFWLHSYIFILDFFVNSRENFLDYLLSIVKHELSESFCWTVQPVLYCFPKE